MKKSDTTDCSAAARPNVANVRKVLKPMIFEPDKMLGLYLLPEKNEKTFSSEMDVQGVKFSAMRWGPGSNPIGNSGWLQNETSNEVEGFNSGGSDFV